MDEEGKILDRFRLKAIAIQKVATWKKNYGQRVELMTTEERREKFK